MSLKLDQMQLKIYLVITASQLNVTLLKMVSGYHYVNMRLV